MDVIRVVAKNGLRGSLLPPLVGRAPRPAADPLVGLLEHRKSRTPGSSADEGVGPTFRLRQCCFAQQPFQAATPAFVPAFSSSVVEAVCS